MELHCWAHRGKEGQEGPRIALPGMPCRVKCQPGKANALTSVVGGFFRVEKEKETEKRSEGRQKGAGKRGQKAEQEAAAAKEAAAAAAFKEAEKIAKEAMKAEERGRAARASRESAESVSSMAKFMQGGSRNAPVLAGELIQVRTLIRDLYKNLAEVPEGVLSVSMIPPSGEPETLVPANQPRGGLTAYDMVRYEPRVTGDYAINFKLGGTPMEGSPLKLTCLPAAPVTSKSRCVGPDDPQPFYAGTPYKFTIFGVDRFGNQLERGGSYVNARLVSTGSLPLAPQQETSFEAEDMEDGSYEIYVTLKGAADVKIIVGLHASADSVSNDRAYLAQAEFPPMHYSFSKSKEAAEADAKKAAEEQEAQEAVKKKREQQEAAKRAIQDMAMGGAVSPKATPPGTPGRPASLTRQKSGSFKKDGSKPGTKPAGGGMAERQAAAEAKKMEEMAQQQMVAKAKAKAAKKAKEGSMSKEDSSAATLQRAQRAKKARAEVAKRRELAKAEAAEVQRQKLEAEGGGAEGGGAEGDGGEGADGEATAAEKVASKSKVSSEEMEAIRAKLAAAREKDAAIAAAVAAAEAGMLAAPESSRSMSSDDRSALDTGRSALDTGRVSFRSVETSTAESDRSAEATLPSIINAPANKRVAELQLPPQRGATRSSSPRSSSPRSRQAPPTSARRDASPRGGGGTGAKAPSGRPSSAVPTAGSSSGGSVSARLNREGVCTSSSADAAVAAPASARVEGGRSKSWGPVDKVVAQVGVVKAMSDGVIKTKREAVEAAILDSASLEAAAAEFVRKADAESAKLNAGIKSLATRLGEVLIAKRITVSELVATWAKGPHSEPISKMEFRQHVRKLVEKVDAKEIDALYIELDRDGSGSLDVHEMKLALKQLHDAAARGSSEEAAIVSAVERFRKRAEAASNAAKVTATYEAACAKLKAHKMGGNPLKERVGVALSAKGMKVNEMVLKWDTNGNGEIEKEEFRNNISQIIGVEGTEEAMPGGAIDELFAELDRDKGGSLDQSEVKYALRHFQDVTKQAGGAVKALEKVVTQCLEPARVVQAEWNMLLQKDTAEEAAALEAVERKKAERVKAEEEKKKAEAEKAKRKAAEEVAKKAEFDAKVKAKREAVRQKEESSSSFRSRSGSPTPSRGSPTPARAPGVANAITSSK